ncbi:MAG: tRNA lysidine(34) synthetase TilS, partial [Patescibacteria group bacterium]|nr:tRNA lysidine(34) synthetase TilS [Patescibacteria group bacterium]
GIDSVVLLDLLNELRDELKLNLIVAHADHGLRRGSAKDSEFVESLAHGLGLPFVSTRLDLNPGGNVEARAREARYRWLESVRKRRKADFIVTAHQADDQVETLFLHLARGTGMQGLSGMRMLSGNILRPLLATPRSHLTRHARRRKLKFRRDPSNRNVKRARNRVRHQVIRSLRKINPQLVETVSQSMRVFSTEYEVARILAARELAQVTVSTGGTGRKLKRAKLMKMDRGVRHLVWREALRQLAGDLRGFALRHLEQLDDLLHRQTGSRAHLPRGVTATRQYDAVVLRVGPAAVPPKRTVLPVPGEAGFGDRRISAKAVTRARPESSGSVVIVDAEAVGDGLVVRPPRPGDRFKPVGMRGSKLVSDLLTDAKVPRDERPWVPVVVSPPGKGRGRRQQIVWVAGYRADRRFAPRRGKSRIVLRLI